MTTRPWVVATSKAMTYSSTTSGTVCRTEVQSWTESICAYVSKLLLMKLLHQWRWRKQAAVHEATPQPSGDQFKLQHALAHQNVNIVWQRILAITCSTFAHCNNREGERVNDTQQLQSFTHSPSPLEMMEARSQLRPNLCAKQDAGQNKT